MELLTRVSLRQPAVAGVALLLVTAALALGLPRVRTEFGSRVLIGDDHPAIRTLDAFIARFGGGVPLYIAWGCGPGRPCASVFDDASLRMAHEVSIALAALPGVSRVWSPSDAPIFVPQAGGFAIRRMVENGAIAADRDALATQAAGDPTWVGNLVSADARVGAIVVQPVASESGTDALLVEAVLDAIAPHAAFDFALVGEAFGNVIGGRELADSTAALIPLMVIVIAAVIFVQTRSWPCVVATLATLGVALVWTFGALGFLGWPRDSILEILAPLILIIGVCDAIYYFSCYASRLGSAGGAAAAERAARRDSLEAAAREVSIPCLLTTATTGAAFLSFATSDLDTFERFGVVSALGVCACFVLTFSLLPLLLWALPGQRARSAQAADTWRAAMEALVRTSERRALPILAVAAVLVSLCAFSWIAYLRVDTSRQEMFGEGSRILRWVRFFEQGLRPSVGIEVDLELPAGSPVEDPQVLGAVSRFAAAIEREPGTGTAWSAIDHIARLNAMLHGGNASHGRIGATPEANAELLEILELEDPELLGSWLSFDRRHLRVSLDVTEISYASAVRLIDAVESHAARILPPDWKIELTGTVPLGFHWVTDVQATQLRSFPTAFLLVLVLVAGFLRSLPLGLAALLPAVAPAVVVLGAMGAIGLSLDVGRSMIAAVILGIAVDDSIHLLHRFRFLRGQGAPDRLAFRQALIDTGRPIVITSVALALGFMTLTASAWGTVSGFGFFVSLSIMVALLATLFVLPALAFTLLPRVERPGAAAREEARETGNAA